MHGELAAYEISLIVGAFLLFFSVVLSRASEKLGVPALLLFFAVGMLAGSDGPGGIPFDDPLSAQSIGVMALALILFSGGMDTRWEKTRPIFWAGISLSTIGIVITAVCVGLFACWVGKCTLLEGLLLGVIVSSTDSAAVFTILRASNVGLKDKLKQLLEFESGSNDPMAVFLTVGLIHLIANPGTSPLSLVSSFFIQMILGALIGFIIGNAAVFIINRIRLGFEGLYPVLTVSLVFLIYGACLLLHGNGFLAVYIAGIIVGNRELVHKKSLLRFHDGLAWLMQIMMFLTLGLQVFPSRIVPLIPVGLMIALFLMLFARPIAVFISLAFFKMDIREKIMISWIGLRGASPIILATFPLLAGLAKADIIFHMVFFIVLTSSLLQGTTIPLVTRLLKMDEPSPVDEDANLPQLAPEECVFCKMSEVKIKEDSRAAGKQLAEAGFPQSVQVLLVHREEQLIQPTGGTILEPNDTLLVLAEKEAVENLRSLVGEPKTK